MVYKRYIKRDGKIFGPYYYESYRDENGIPRIKKVDSPNVKTFNLKFIFVGLLALLLISIFALGSNVFHSGSKKLVISYDVLNNKVVLKERSDNVFSKINKNLFVFFIPTLKDVQEVIDSGSSSEVSPLDDSSSTSSGVSDTTSVSSDSQSLVETTSSSDSQGPGDTIENQLNDQGYIETTNQIDIPEEVVSSQEEIISQENSASSLEISESQTQDNSSQENSSSVAVIEENNNLDNITSPTNVSDNFTHSSNQTESTNLSLNESILQNFSNSTNVTLNEIGILNISSNETIFLENNSNLTNINLLNSSSENIILNISNQTLPLNISFNLTELANRQYIAVLGKPVKWVKKIKVESDSVLDNFELDLSEASNVSIKKINSETGEKEDVKLKVSNEKNLENHESTLEKEFFDNVMNFFLPLTGNVISKNSNTLIEVKTPIKNQDVLEIEYYTEPPRSYERIEDYGKRILVSGPDTIHYKNILAYTELPSPVKNPAEVNFYWMNGKNGKEKVNFKAYDYDSDGLFDHISWVVPHLSNQTYEIILITKAKHLDENRNFIEDVYDLVKDKDNNFTNPIPSNHYIRVKFEQNLTSQNDITVYAKSSSQNASLEVYEKDSNNSIANFDRISNYSKYKIYLDNLNGSQDTFDLKILNGAIQFDYIVDPFTGGGSGTAADPYQITNCTQLQEMENNLNSYYILMNDINCSDTINWNAGLGFSPVGQNSLLKFSGGFNGSNYTISDLYISRGAKDYIALFGYSSAAVIKDVNLVNVTVAGSSYVGSLIGYNLGGQIVNSFSSGSVTSAVSDTGGLIGYSEGGTIYDSHSNVTVVGGTAPTGGLIGGTQINKDGVTYTEVNNSYYIGSVTGGSDGGTGGLIGSAKNTNINYSYSNVTLSSFSSSGGLIGSDLSSNVKESYSAGTLSGTTDSGGLIGYIKTANINNSYSSVFVSGSSSVGGLVGQIVSVTNIYNSNASGNVSASSGNVGGLVGYSSASTTNIYNSRAFGNVTSSSSGVGGFIGDNLGNITNSSASGNVLGSTAVGGFVGLLTSGNIFNSFSLGDSNATTIISAGFVGRMNAGVINNSYARGDSYSQDYVSGFVSFGTGGTVQNSYASGNATLTGLGTSEGGFSSGGGGTTCINSYWDNQTSSQNNDSCGGGVSANLTQEMKSKTTFNSTWGFCNDASNPWAINTTANYNSYPCLDWEYSYCGCPGTSTIEVCDGIDNDYDSLVDEGLGQTTCGVGACEVTVNNCVSGVSQTCTPGTSTSETCDGIDNDCDGSIDEGGVCSHGGPPLEEIRQFTVEPNYISLTLSPGDSGSRTFTITNTGNVPLDLITELVGPPMYISLSSYSVSLVPQEAEIVSVDFNVPNNAPYGNYGWSATVKEDSPLSSPITGNIISGNPIRSAVPNSGPESPVTTINLNPISSTSTEPVTDPTPFVDINILLNVVSPNPVEQNQLEQLVQNTVDAVSDFANSVASSFGGIFSKSNEKKDKEIKKLSRGIAVLVLWIFLILLLVIYFIIRKYIKIKDQLNGYKSRDEKIAELNKMKRESLRAKSNPLEKLIDKAAFAIAAKNLGKSKHVSGKNVSKIKHSKVKHKNPKVKHHKVKIKHKKK